MCRGYNFHGAFWSLGERAPLFIPFGSPEGPPWELSLSTLIPLDLIMWLCFWWGPFLHGSGDLRFGDTFLSAQPPFITWLSFGELIMMTYSWIFLAYMRWFNFCWGFLLCTASFLSHDILLVDAVSHDDLVIPLHMSYFRLSRSGCVIYAGVIVVVLLF